MASDTLTGTNVYPAADVVITITNIAASGYYDNSEIAGITIQTGSSHVKVSPATSFSIVKVNAAPPVIQLVSVSEGLFFLSEQTQGAAGIVFFKNEDEVPLTAILNNSMEGGT